ncbi:MAG TPA: hypothetical protein GXX49_00720 [Clostridiaceae bacterium]|nr:hypothetical protein [Clostridiaceae bacterium]
MCDIKVGDIVCRKSYGSDVIFKVVAVKEEGSQVIADLKGINCRLMADAPREDLELHEVHVEMHRGPLRKLAGRAKK